MTLQEIRQQYPQYEDMSDAQLARALHSRYYSDMDFGEFSQRVGLQAAEPPSRTELALDTVSRMPGLGFLSPEVRQAGAEVGRQAGLAGRYLLEGPLGLAAMVAQPFVDVADIGLEAAGSDFRFGNQYQGASRLLDNAGLPRPQNGLERIVGDASRALSGGGGITGTAQWVARNAQTMLPRIMGAVRQAPLNALPRIAGAESQAPQSVASILTQGPRMQAAGEILGGAGAGVTRELGGGPLAQLAAGTVAGFAAPAAYLGGQSATRGVRAVLDTLSDRGREGIAARVLQEQATDPRRAAENIALSGEIVPGSLPTTGPASRDIGLLSFERWMRSRHSDQFGVRLSQQNAARQRALDDIAGDETDIAAAIARREEGTTAAREAAFDGNPQVDTAPILARADEILAGPTGARREVRRAIEDFREAIAGETDAQRLYGIRQDMGAAMGGRLRSSDRADYQLAKRELIQLQRALDEQIEAVAPGFRDYLASYSELSKPINQMEQLQDLVARSRYQESDITSGYENLSPRFRRNLDNLLRNRERSRDLTPEQIRVARAVATDLDASNAINSANIRAPGSDTYQNLSSANVIRNVRGGGRVSVPEKTMLRWLDWLFEHSDKAIDEVLTEAMLDPALAERLLRAPTPENMQALSLGFAEKMRMLGYGTGVGLSTSAGQTEPQ